MGIPDACLRSGSHLLYLFGLPFPRNTDGHYTVERVLKVTLHNNKKKVATVIYIYLLKVGEKLKNIFNLYIFIHLINRLQYNTTLKWRIVGFRSMLIKASTSLSPSQYLGRRDRMVVGFTTTYAISAYHHWCCEFESRSGWDVHYVIKIVSDLRQIGGFLRVLRFPPPIKLTATI